MRLSHQNTILVVDDQSLSRNLLNHMLTINGYAVVEAENGEYALELARTTKIDGILLDIRMPGIGGIETCRRFRAMEKHRVTPILFVSASEEHGALLQAFEAGCDDFITKPIEPIVLKARLRGHIKRAKLYYQLERVTRYLNRYISPRTLKMVEQYSGSGQLPTPERVEVCVLFADIRGFTQLSQQIEPKRLFSLLSEHLAAQVDLVYLYEGYVDKFAGDGIMAVFEGKDMALLGCQCALDIIDHARHSCTDTQDQLFAVGCGLHQGEAVIGNIGSIDHLDYSVIGESVNLAARLCGFAEPMSVIVSENIYKEVKDKHQLHFSNERHIEVKGFKNEISVYELKSHQS